MAASWSVTRVLYSKYQIKTFKSLNGFKKCIVCTRSSIRQKSNDLSSISPKTPSLSSKKLVPTSVVWSCNNNNNSKSITSNTLCKRLNYASEKHYSKKANISSVDRKDIITYDRPTLPGEKKDVTCPLPSAYSPQYVETAWYEWWEKSGVFQPQLKENGDGSSQKAFVVCLPPPNVTGNLHLGHALTTSIQDSIIRWHRMKGETTLWVPGTDHAGIATQVVVEKKLWKDQRKTRHELGREKFVEEIWKWKNEKGEIINDQMKKMGSSLDWNRSRFTMDEPMSRAVTEAFVRLHDEGLIYRSDRLVNWCCHLKSTISDIEVESKDLQGRTLLAVPDYDKPIKFGVLHSFAYPVAGSDEEVVVATTRLETMLGDVAVMVHPEDTRFRHLHGKFVIHPFDGRLLPIVTDSSVDKSFGSGAVKVTPAHDQTDYNVGLTHGLPVLDILDDDGRLINVPVDFQGMKRFDARETILMALKEKGLYRGQKENSMVLPVCSRSGDVIEPRLKEQWFVSCDQMAEEAAQVVQSGELEIMPAMYQSEWFNWLDNIKDWCISRQLWWGHRIPAYWVKHKSSDDGGIWVCGRNESEALEKGAEKLSVASDEIIIKQDEDVLDTWFSSALFPFAVFGWPDQTDDIHRFYPTSLLETGHDILFFWVVRMVMLGQKLTGSLPFNQILLHGILRDAHGRKMSKSLGNVIDPMDVIHGLPLMDLQKQLDKSNLSSAEIQKAKAGQRSDFPDGIPECGTDALRFTLCSYNIKVHEISLDVTHVKSTRHFCNKIWQAFKFVSMNIGEDFQQQNDFQVSDKDTAINQWIVSRLSHMVQSCDLNFESHNLHLVTRSLHQFWYQEFCNVYLESIKPVLWDIDSPLRDAVQETLWFCMETALRATSPFMPFLTEELYQRLPGKGRSSSICIAPYPNPANYPWYRTELDKEMDQVLEITHKISSLKKDFNVNKLRPNCFLQTSENKMADWLQKYSDVISTLSRCGEVRFVDNADLVSADCISSVINSHCSLHLQIKDLLDPKTEAERLQRRQEKILKKLDKVVFLTQKKGYQSKTSQTSQAKHLEKVDSLKKELEHINSMLESLKKLW